MKLTIQKTSYVLIALTLVFAMSCGGTSSSENGEHEHIESMEHNDAKDHNMNEHTEDNDMKEKKQHSEGMSDSKVGEAFTWMAMEEHKGMLAYKTDNVTMMKHGEDNVMIFFPKGEKALCMFTNKQGSVGVTATIKLEGNDGEVKLIHHSIDKDNYEFVALKGNTMNLGRVVKGEEKILDSKEVEVPTDWFTLTVTAAGTHFKGYLNDKMITHGHADEMATGYVGMSASGNSMLSVKKVEATPLEVEH